MISFFRGPGGLMRRLAAEFVPMWVGLLCAAFLLPLVGPAIAALAWPAIWFVMSVMLRGVREHVWLRRAYRVALLAHVVFWGAMGIRAQSFDVAGHAGASTHHAWPAASAFRVGFAAEPYALPAQTTLAGWGKRPRRENLPAFGGIGLLGELSHALMGSGSDIGQPTHPLFARPDRPGEAIGVRAFVLAPEDEPSAAPLALVAMDLVNCDDALVEAVFERVAPLGFVRETFVLAATHTHSGPGQFARAPLSEIVGTDHFDPAVFEAIVTACVEAVERAYRDGVPAGLVARDLHDRDGPARTPILARNRRAVSEDAIDDRVTLLTAWPARGAQRPGAGAKVLGHVLGYGVHPVASRARHKAWSRDLPGGLERAAGAPLVFLNGAAGDVTVRVPLEPTDDPKVHVDGLAQRFWRRVVDGGGGGAGRRFDALRVRASITRVGLGTPHTLLTVGDRSALVGRRGAISGGGPLGILGDVVALPCNLVLWSSGATEVRVLADVSGAGVLVNLADQVPQRFASVGVIDLEAVDRSTMDVQRFRIAWTPGEATTALGRAWRMPLDADMLIGFANGAVGYMTTPEEYERESYESVGTLFGPEGGREFLTALMRSAGGS